MKPVVRTTEIANGGVILGDCLEVMKERPGNVFHAVVTDPPYGLKFMGKAWDHGVPGEPYWAEMLRVCRPGAYLLAFGGTRTYHRLACAIEDAGWEIRDCIMWVYGSGFPKSLDVGKAIDKEAGVERGTSYVPHGDNQVFGEGKGKAAGVDRTPGAKLSDPPATEAAKQWNGYGTALKPAYEPIIVARKPIEKTVASNVQKHGCGAMNIDQCRVPSGIDHAEKCASVVGLDSNRNGNAYGEWTGERTDSYNSEGRWPANLIHDGSEEVGGLFPVSNSNNQKRNRNMRKDKTQYRIGGDHETTEYGDSGSAARFFYTPKASKSERGKDNKHPTVKPLKLMEYLLKLVCPPGSLVLEPFMGSGSTLVAGLKLNMGLKFIGIENDLENYETAIKRIAEMAAGPGTPVPRGRRGSRGVGMKRESKVTERRIVGPRGCESLDCRQDGTCAVMTRASEQRAGVSTDVWRGPRWFCEQHAAAETKEK